jgi:hypothetical protein
MKNNTRTENVTRESILKLLSDDEVASVCTSETKVCLAEHDEYIDLAMGRMLPRKAVHPDTWSKILTALAAFRSLGAASGK